MHRAHVSRVLEKLPNSSKEEVEEAYPNKLRVCLPDLLIALLSFIVQLH